MTSTTGHKKRGASQIGEWRLHSHRVGRRGVGWEGGVNADRFQPGTKKIPRRGRPLYSPPADTTRDELDGFRFPDRRRNIRFFLNNNQQQPGGKKNTKKGQEEKKPDRPPFHQKRLLSMAFSNKGSSPTERSSRKGGGGKRITRGKGGLVGKRGFTFLQPLCVTLLTLFFVFLSFLFFYSALLFTSSSGLLGVFFLVFFRRSKTQGRGNHG
ncbi:hypothetical protein LY76DRAFT_292366 [Colletotrichum caudatum]|nr:hypothetical protein LY76DRAFT_292366 [Colletotrichum caudatum]